MKKSWGSRSRSDDGHRYPIATVATYGPNNTLVTKVVASVFERPGQSFPSVTETWTAETVDVSHRAVMLAQVARFTGQHGVKETTISDRIIGCPHEEGIDYPMGRTCPRCPFWAGINRFTHEPITAPAPTMTPEEILNDLSIDRREPPHDALESAEGHRGVLVEPLLQAIDRGLVNPSGASAAEATLFSYALYILAKWRESRAYPHVIRWLSLPGEAPFDIAGDVVTEDGGRILASVCDGDLEPIKGLIVNRSANEYGRSAGVSALALLAAWGEVPRESVVDMLLWLAREGLERTPSAVWSSLAVESADIEALPLFPDLRQAHLEGLIDPQHVSPSDLDDAEAAPRGFLLEETRERCPPIDDVVEATAWWGDFHDGEPEARPEPYRAPPKVGRNEPCPCGSGKKYKKCCGA